MKTLDASANASASFAPQMGPEHRGCLTCSWDPHFQGNAYTGALCNHPNQHDMFKSVPLTPCPGWKARPKPCPHLHAPLQEPADSFALTLFRNWRKCTACGESLWEDGSPLTESAQGKG